MNNNSKDEAKALAEGKKSSNVGTLQDIELVVLRHKT
jgi:hypothetical protein